MQRPNLNLTTRNPEKAHLKFGPGLSTPSFAPTRRLQSPGFWTNLKDFLTERSIRVPRNAPQKVFYTEGVDTSFSESLKAFFRPAPRMRGPAASGMVVDLEPTYRVFWRSLRDLIAPRRLLPLKLTSKPVPVRPLWAKRREYSTAQMISVGVQVLIAVLIIVPFARKIVPTVQAIQVIDISPYLSKLPPGKEKAVGVAGGGEHKQEPQTQGKLPKWSKTGITAPVL